MKLNCLFPNLIILIFPLPSGGGEFFSQLIELEEKRDQRKKGSSAEKKWLHSYADLWPHEVYNLILEANYTMETNQKNNNTDKTNSKEFGKTRSVRTRTKVYRSGGIYT